MRELSIFIDESGDFGSYEHRSPYYIVSLVFHDQAIDIMPNLLQMQQRMEQLNIPNHTVHSGPLIRREMDYKDYDIVERKRVFDRLFYFIYKLDISYHTLIVEKKQILGENDLTTKITKQLESFLFENIQMLTQYDRIVVYYDHGQKELTTILLSVFNTVLQNVEFKKVSPADYKLFQVADMLCTLELLALKREHKALSKSELKFFKSAKDLYKSYIRAIRKKRI